MLAEEVDPHGGRGQEAGGHDQVEFDEGDLGSRQVSVRVLLSDHHLQSRDGVSAEWELWLGEMSPPGGLIQGGRGAPG